jgi:hypothetical protein
MVAIGLQKPYARTKVGESCTCMLFDVLTQSMVIGDRIDTWITFSGSEYRTIIEQ